MLESLWSRMLIALATKVPPAALDSWLRPCRLTAVKVYATTAGTGGGNTVVDLLRNGVSVWSAAGNRPTLAAVSTGEFTNTRPDRGVGLDPGDRIAFQVASISTTGHARLSASAALERP